MKFFPHQFKKQVKEIKGKHFYPTISNIEGKILEIGVGKGENLKYYNNKCSVFAIDKNLDEKMLEKYSEEVNCSVMYSKNVIENIDIENETLDYVVGTFVLCSVESVNEQISAIYKKLKIGGKIIFLEHIRSNNHFWLFIQRLFTKIFRILSLECHMDRNPCTAIKKAGFKIIEEKYFQNSIEPYLFIVAMKL
jgi:SAM-dependent methyltransferase